MRIAIHHETRYDYDASPLSVVQMLRMTPRSCNSQYVVDWRIDIDHNCRLVPRDDAFGNIVHGFSLAAPIKQIVVLVEGIVETTDTNGIVSGTVERFPETLYLRETDLTMADAAMQDYGAALGGLELAHKDRLAFLHALMGAIHRDFTFDTAPTGTTTKASEAFALKRGVCQDFAHVFIGIARQYGVPARYVGGYFWREDGVTQQDAGHAWAEAFVPGLGWVGFDPANDTCPIQAHVRVAIGLDYQGAAPVRGTRYGGDGERLAVNLTTLQQGGANQ